MQGTDSRRPAASPLRLHRLNYGDPSLRKVSKLVGIDAGTISDLEKGSRFLQLHHSVALGEFYGIAPGELLKQMAEWCQENGMATAEKGAAA